MTMENRGISLKNGLLSLLITFFALLAIAPLYAQSFPVNVRVQNLGASPTQLSSYADAAQANGPLRATLTLNDLNITGREVQLRLSFQGNGISLQSVPNPIGAGPFFLDGGIPLTLNATELAPYFEISNLTGISPTVYGRPLPEGSYQICFEVVDVLTGKRLSARSCANVFLFRNRPPFLVLPANGTQVDRTNPQNIVFQWTPRQLNITNVEYELSLVEIWDGTIDPQAAFLAAPPMFRTTTGATSYLYGPADPILLPNHAYAWRVRAKTVDGADDVGLFENQGNSKIFSFVHLAPCEVPPNLRHELRGSGQANILWDDPSTEVPEFTVRYRQKGEGNAWFLNRTTANWTTLWDLRAGTPYEYQLKKDCGPGESDWSPIREFTTALETETEDLYRCGISPNIDIQNQEPLSNLSVGQQFVAGDFTVTTTQVNGGEGYYSGRGHVRVPYLGNVKLAVYFDNILLNTDRQLLQGTVVTEYDPTINNILDTGDVVETVDTAIDAIAKTLDELFNQLLNVEIDRTTRQNIEDLTNLLVEQAKAELPEPLANAIEDASNRMVEAKKSYDTAIQNGDQAMVSEAETNFTNAQNDLKSAEKERDNFIDAYASIIEEALRKIVIESNGRLEAGLESYGEESVVEKENGEILELTSNGLDQISNFMGFEEIKITEQEQIDHFEYERWTVLNYIATNLQTVEGTKNLGNLLENEGESLGLYIYSRLNEGTSNEELITETKELIVQIISEKIALTLELF